MGHSETLIISWWINGSELLLRRREVMGIVEVALIKMVRLVWLVLEMVMIVMMIRLIVVPSG